MTPRSASSRGTFALDLAAKAASGEKILLRAPLGAGKTHALIEVRQALAEASVPFVFIDLFTAASTPEKLLAVLIDAAGRFMGSDLESIDALARAGAADRHRAHSALLGLLDLLATKAPTQPFVWLVDEVTEIRSLAYFPDLSHVEAPFARAILASRGSIVTSSYPGLAQDLFPDFTQQGLPGLDSSDLEMVPSLRSDSGAISAAIAITGGLAATLLPLVGDLRDSRDVSRSLIFLLRPGGALDLTCRRHYEVLLMRSRGYAVCKRTAEVVAGSPGARLTDLFPKIGRTPGASRQYLKWLVEVGLFTQVHKRYDFADPLLGLWAGLYLGRAGHPSDAEIADAVSALLRPNKDAPELLPRPQTREVEFPKRRVDRFEEID